jgi:hypothetical protein
MVSGNRELPYAANFLLARETIARSKKFYEWANCNDVLDDWNLPRQQEDLLKLIEGVRNSPSPEQTMFERMHEPTPSGNGGCCRPESSCGGAA